jgi:hypothetical protein
MAMIRPMNQMVVGPLFIVGKEVGDAYEQAMEAILGHPQLSKFQYLLTVEDDNLPPPDGLVRLYEAIEGKVTGQRYDAVGGLYWTKGREGQPMIYGDPKRLPKDFMPQIPLVDTVQACNGLGMGFTLFRMSMFKDKRLEKPLFKTEQQYTPGVGVSMFTQDLRFFHRAGALGYKIACDTRVKVGHLDIEGDYVW